ncbi:DUF736 domain-containing protein [Sphingomonas sp. AR_OL41]|uniref:DUF736 domain-containing protein n=1 Tax=Sphingomonas sp. AR_OL41 TaxID=3042729 RepID=UPI002480A04E|nr:DUF736 domain-containing protein [Sphingomonas sp. AR_OL41]MDH7972469.1 DUF736 domain-containing protein [Sphingomonas sp. AR_OL41]
MTQIGRFTRTADGFHGRIETLSLNAELCLVPADADGENAPDYRIHLGADGEGLEVGAGWKRVGERAGAYFSLLIDDPALPQSINANLFQSNREREEHHLVWNRPSRRGSGS